MLGFIHASISEAMNSYLSKSISLEEIKEDVFQMGGMKAPGPDGFQGVFYHSYWDIIVDDVNGLIQDFAHSGGNPRNLNSTHIVLIPKTANPTSVNQLWPISLCNYSYKIFSKLLENRLKPWLPSIISPAQTAFVEGRQIQDNILVAHEVFHFLKLRKVKIKLSLL